MYSKLSPKQKDLVIEISTVIFILIFLAAVGMVVIFGFIYPFPTYQYYDATVEYRNEVPITTEVSGIIEKVLVENNSTVRSGQHILRLNNTSDLKQFKLLNLEIQKLESNLEKSKRLLNLGVVSKLVIDEQEAQLKSYRYKRDQYLTKTIKTPYSGQIYFYNDPEELTGVYLHIGQKVGYVYSSDEKVVTLKTSTADVRKLKIGALAKVFSKNTDKKSHQMIGEIKRATIDRTTNILSVNIVVEKGYDELQKYKPGSLINVGVLISDKSLFESFFDIDIYSMFFTEFDEKVDSYMEKITKWILKK